MKQTTKYILALLVMILSTTSIMAGGNGTYIYKIEGAGAGSENPGTVKYEGGGVITVTPATGFYLTVADLTVIKTLDGQNADARRRAPGFNTTVALTASDPSADPSQKTTYTFTVTDPNYDYEITANFHRRTDISNATVTVNGGPFTYNGSAITPAVTVVSGGKTLTKGTDYTVTYTDNTNAGTGKITITGTRTYIGTKTGTTFTINKATMDVTATGYTGVFDGNPHGITVTVNSPAGATVKYGETAGTYDLDASPTYTNGGTYTVYYEVTKANYTTVTGSQTVTITQATAQVYYENYDFTITLGDEFTEPELTLNPPTLVVTYSSSDPEIASVDPQTGEVTVHGAGRVYISATFAGDANYAPTSDYYVITIQLPQIDPIDKDVVYTMNEEDFFFYNEHGERVERRLDNTVIYDILFTLDIEGDPELSDGYDEDEHCIVLNHPMTPYQVNRVLRTNYIPGTMEYAEAYTGMTFKVPAGTGYIIIDCRTDGENQMMVKVGDLEPVAFNHENRDKDYILYSCLNPTWIYVYNGGPVNGARLNTNRGKKEKGSVRIYSVTRTSSSTGIELINSDELENDNWYDLQGNKITFPQKKGIYIWRGQKVVVN